MLANIISIETLRQRSQTLDMLLTHNDIYNKTEKILSLGECHEQYLREQLDGFLKEGDIEQYHKQFVVDLSNPVVNFDIVVSRIDTRILLVLLDYYAVDTWKDEFVNFVLRNKRANWIVFNALLLLSFADHGIVDRFSTEVDAKQNYRPMPPFRFNETPRRNAKCFGDIYAAIGTRNRNKST